MRIDVFSDVVCPWCYVGKRHLEAALGQAGVTDAEIHWHAFQLNPDLPPEGMDRRAYLMAKFGTEGVERIHERVQEAGRAAGIAFEFENIRRSPNTFDAHRLLQLAGPRQGALKEALMRAYFLEGRDVGDRATLAAIAVRTGIEGDVQALLAGDAGAQAVRDDLALAGRIGISGVPFFIFGGRYALAGAQPPQVLAQALQAARNAPAAGPIG
ncbi:MAG TPA: DsbA family oxidoreductase [Gammaproteobacteria bacterium]